MSTEDPLKNWQLENREQEAEHWKLEDADQDLAKHLQLQQGELDTYWQPVEYERNAATRRRNWVLPSVLIVALLAVLGYVGWIAMGQLGGSGLDITQMVPGMAATEPAATPAEEAAAAAAAVTATPAEPTPTLEPTATSAPAETPTPTVEPTPAIAMAQLISGTVNAVGGVNARKEEAITGEVVQLLNEGERVVVTRDDGEWLQVILPDGARVAYVRSEFVDRTALPLPLAELASIYTRAGLPAPTPVAVVEPGAITASTEATATGATAPLTNTITGSTAVEFPVSTVVPPAPFTNTLPAVGPVLVVTDTTGVNARNAAGTDGDIITIVPEGAVLPVIGRTPAGDWLQVSLPDGTTGWMFAQAVVASSDAAVAPVTANATEQQATATPVAASPGATPAGAGAPSGATATVTNALGAILRPAPSRNLDGEVYDPDTTFTVVGRSGDGEWVQLVLPDGSLAWALAATVQLSVPLETLPVTQP